MESSALVQRLFVQAGNVVLLVVVLVGIPAITSLRLGALRLSSDPMLQMLTLGGLGVAAALNGLAAVYAVKDRKARRACWAWAALFSIVLVVEYGYFNGYVGFGWLKEFLLGLKRRI